MKRQTSRRQAVLVLGMHRSGTSAISGVLARLGVQPPKSLMVPTKDNPKGYWESTALMRFHDEVLASAGTMWSDWDQFNPHWMESAVAEDFMSRLPGILTQEYGDERLFLVKDPRICRLLPLWLRVLADLDITPRFVVPVRHPLEVARSLEVRNEFGRNRSYLAWLRHMLDAEYYSRDNKRVFIGYADMLVDWRTQIERISRDLDIKWPKWSSSVEVDIDGFLTTELRHHAASGEISVDSSGVSGWVAQAHQDFLQLATVGPGTDGIQQRLNHLRVELDRSGSIYASVVRECEVKSEARIKQLDGRLAETSEKYDGLVRALAELADVLKAWDTDAMQQLPPPVGELTALTEQLRAAKAIQVQSANAHATEIADLSSRLEASQADLSQSASRHEAQVAEINDRHAGEVKLLQSQSASKHEAQVAEIKLLQSQFASRHEAQVAEINDRHAGEVKLLQEAKRKAEESLQVRFMEIAKLTSMVLDLERDIAKERALRSDEKSESDSRLAGLERELDLYRGIASDRQDQLRLMQEGRLWKVVAMLRRMVRPSATPSEGVTLVPDDEAIRQSGLFDRAWYLKRYPDVRKRGMDPVKHYLRYGASEKRDPGPGFSTKSYLHRYPDVAASGLNPLLHYVRYGIGEGRLARDRGEKKES